MRKRRVQRVLATLALFGALGAVLAFVTGALSYVTTHGVSMLPAFHTGDLVIVRSAGSYHVGEIVAYYSPLLHTTVLHRIVADHGGLFTFKGDSNPWVDPLRLPASSIRGTMLLHLPRVGTLLSWAIAPAHAVLIGICISLIAAATLTARSRKNRSARPSLGVRRRSTSSAPGWTIAGVVVLVAAGTCAAIAFATPLRHSSSVRIPYREQVSFSYAGQATKGTTYPDGTITTGQPIFVKLLRNLGVRASYALTAPGAAHISGTMTLTAEVVDGDGWSRQLVATSPVSFRGADGVVAAAVPVPNAVALIKEAADETGIASGANSLNFTAQISVHGAIGSTPVSDHFSVPISFELSTLEINLLPTSNGPAGPVFAQLQTTRSGSVQQLSAEPTTVGIGGHHLAVRVARAGALIGLALGTLLLAVGLVRLCRRRAMDADERALRRIHRDLVPIESDPSVGGVTAVDVATISALVDIADRAESLVLDYRHENGHTYFTDIDDVLYRFVRRADSIGARGSDDGDVVLGDSPGADLPRDDTVGEAIDGVVESQSRDVDATPELEDTSDVSPQIVALPQVLTTNPENVGTLSERSPLASEASDDASRSIAVVEEVASVEGALEEDGDLEVPAANGAEPIDFPNTINDSTPESADQGEPDAPRRELGLNAWFAEEMHQDFLEDPRSVSDSWRCYFEAPDTESTEAKIFMLHPRADSADDTTGEVVAGSGVG